MKVHVTLNLAPPVRQSYLLFSHDFICLGENYDSGTFCDVQRKKHVSH